MTTDRGQFFGGLRRALGTSAGRSEASEDWTFEEEDRILARAAAVEADAAERAAELIEQLASSAEAGGWVVHRAANAEDALGKVVDIARALGVKTLVRSDHDVLRKTGGRRTAREGGDRGDDDDFRGRVPSRVRLARRSVDLNPGRDGAKESVRWPYGRTSV